MSDLIELPEVVVRSLLRCLDFPAKLALRQVCSTTNEWVTDKDFARNVKAPLSSSEDLEYWICKHEEVSESGGGGPHYFLGWVSSFIFLQDLRQFNELKISQFLQVFGNQIEKLEFLEWTSDTLKFWKLIYSLNIHLKSVKIHDLKVTTARTSIPALDIERLSILQISFHDADELYSWHWIIKSFASRSADFINIPKLNYTGEETDRSFPHLKTLQVGAVIHPILSTLERYRDNTKITLDVQNMFPIHFRMVAGHCRVLGLGQKALDIYFLNVNDEHLKYVTLMGGNGHENDFMTKILSITEKIDDRRPLQMWTNLEDMNIRTSRCYISNSYEGRRDGFFPKLKTLQITFDSSSKEDPGLVVSKRISDLLLKVKRNLVQKLTLKWPEDGDETPMNIVELEEIKSNFPSLKEFIIITNAEQ